MQSFLVAWARCAPATRLSMVAVVFALINPWLGILVGLSAAWLYARSQALDLSRHRALAYFLPVGVALAFIGQGESLPADDLMRHLSAWQLGFDYRPQYPWSNLPKANLWLGFDYLLGVLQSAGATKAFLLQWIPGLSLILQSVVLFFALKRAMPARRHNTELFLLAGAMGLLALTPRSLLGRPEMFLLIFGATAWLCHTRVRAAVWAAGFLLLVPFYWLGWVYAAFALLLAPASLSLVTRMGIATLLGLLHLAFWQAYTGDYLGLLVWLKSTLSVLAGENEPMLKSFSFWFCWVLVGAISLALSTLNKRRFVVALPVGMLLVWFTLPNQIRYVAAITFVALPWLYRTFALWAIAAKTRVPSVVVFMGMGIAAALAVFPTTPVAKFELPATARVYSESPYATVFYGEPGIAVEPSFALGATKPEWQDINKNGVMNCTLLQKGGFTHVIEKSLEQPIACAQLTAVQGSWRLWTLKKD